MAEQIRNCTLGPLLDIQHFPHREAIENPEITHFRKLQATPQHAFALAVLIEFFENILRESTPRPAEQYVKQFADA